MLRSRASSWPYHNLLVHFLQARYFVELWPNVAGLENTPQNYLRIKVLLYEVIGLGIRRRLPTGGSQAIRILYISVHAILEYDDLRMLRALGNIVFPLGEYFAGGRAQGFRPALSWGATEAELLARFEATGCRYDRGPAGIRLSTKFVEQFDLTIVMHDPETLMRQWAALAVRPVVWRTIGQDMVGLEARMAPLRARGLRILRYAEAERGVPGHLGSEGLVRFHKDEAEFGGWTGALPQVLTFANRFVQRYPHEYAVFREATAGLPVAVGGIGNEDLPGALGVIEHDHQKKLLRDSRVYLYCSGLSIPYTLNFIEAWISGIPVVALAEAVVPHAPGYSELPALIRHGENGFIAKDAAEARGLLDALLADIGLAARIGAAGRAEATRIFGTATVAAQWRSALPRLVARARPWWLKWRGR